MMKIEVNIILLYFANQFGKKISKLSFLESEYFRAITVKGHDILNNTKTSPSPMISPIPIQV